MLIEALKGKIHRATVTEANLDYIGSLTLDEDIMNAAGLKHYEKIQVLDVTNGSRIETYVIPGGRGSGKVCINGAAAHLIHAGDLVIIVFYCHISDEELLDHQPKIIHVDADNRILYQFTSGDIGV